MVKIEDYPQLTLICWSIDPKQRLSDEEAFAIYERNWAYVKPDEFTEEERRLVERLIREVGQGVLNV